ncbi:MAG: hypothetical protein Fur0021_34710 [Candidatus Promineifilaceae bacterium]
MEKLNFCANCVVVGYRIPPTFAALRRALSRPQPIWLHLSCHGQVISTTNGPLARLLLEDDNGKLHFLTGSDLAALAPAHTARLALLSACDTAEGQANLARALVHNGLPAAIGMQGLFLDPLSDDLAAALYETLLPGQDVAAAVRQARLALLSHPQMVGLPVLYARREGTAPLPLPPGRADLQRLDLSANLRLPLEVQAPHPLLGAESRTARPGAAAASRRSRAGSIRNSRSHYHKYRRHGQNNHGQNNPGNRLCRAV